MTEFNGGYLVFTTANAGTMTLHYSEKEVKGSMLLYQAKKKIPGFKYTSNAGRVELMRNMGVDKTKFYEGIALFIKDAAAYDGIVYVIDGSEFAMYVLQGTNVVRVEEGDDMDISTCDACAIVPPISDAFQGVKTVGEAEFVNKAGREGAKWKR